MPRAAGGAIAPIDSGEVAPRAFLEALVILPDTLMASERSELTDKTESWLSGRSRCWCGEGGDGLLTGEERASGEGGNLRVWFGCPPGAKGKDASTSIESSLSVPAFFFC